MFKKLITFVITSLIFLASTLYSLSSEIIGSSNYHIVKRGDTIKKISSMYGVSYNQILNTNPLKDPDKLSPGQKLVISSEKIIPKKIYNGLIINIPEYSIYHFKNGILINTYSIAIGKKNWQTPRGRFFVDNKALNPTWRIPPRMARKLKTRNKSVPPGPENPLGKYWIGLSLPHIGIHSTNKPYSIGKALSHGCMRLLPKDAEELFKTLNVGTQGEIIYEPVKVAKKNGKIYIEVHTDVYKLNDDLLPHTIRFLKRERLYNLVDLELVKDALNQKNGIPINISKFNNNIFHHALGSSNDHTGNQLRSNRLWGNTTLN